MRPDLIIQNHCVDDQSTTSDLALEQFRSLFPYTNRLNVWNDGKGMTYEFRGSSDIKPVLKNAMEIISVQNLPLTARAYNNHRSAFLMVEFKIKERE